MPFEGTFAACGHSASVPIGSSTSSMTTSTSSASSPSGIGQSPTPPIHADTAASQRTITRAAHGGPAGSNTSADGPLMSESQHRCWLLAHYVNRSLRYLEALRRNRSTWRSEGLAGPDGPVVRVVGIWISAWRYLTDECARGRSGL